MDEQENENFWSIKNNRYLLTIYDNGPFLIAPVVRYEGTVARLMGDAILAFFGAPVAHEDDSQRAVLAGLAILEEIEPFRDRVREEYGLEFSVRIGINTGMVVVGEIGSDLAMKYTAMGDAVNLAARMEQTAEPGTDSRNRWNGTTMPDTRVMHFWDGERLVGQWFAGQVEGYEGVVWDAYYLFSPEAVWETVPSSLAGSGSTVYSEYETLERQVSTLLGR